VIVPADPAVPDSDLVADFERWGLSVVVVRDSTMGGLVRVVVDGIRRGYSLVTVRPITTDDLEGRGGGLNAWITLGPRAEWVHTATYDVDLTIGLVRCGLAPVVKMWVFVARRASDYVPEVVRTWTVPGLTVSHTRP
jgi:hypothetical protein